MSFGKLLNLKNNYGLTLAFQDSKMPCTRTGFATATPGGVSGSNDGETFGGSVNVVLTPIRACVDYLQSSGAAAVVARGYNNCEKGVGLG